MSTAWRITKDSIKRSRKAGLEAGQFHMVDETLFYGAIEESVKVAGIILGRRYRPSSCLIF